MDFLMIFIVFIVKEFMMIFLYYCLISSRVLPPLRRRSGEPAWAPKDHLGYGKVSSVLIYSLSSVYNIINVCQCSCNLGYGTRRGLDKLGLIRQVMNMGA